MNIIGIITIVGLVGIIGYLIYKAFFDKKENEIIPGPGYPKPPKEEDGTPLPEDPRVPFDKKK